MATVTDADGQPMTDAPLIWSSSDTTVATVDPGGTVTAVGDGWAVIRARAGEATGGADAVVITPATSPDRTECLACHAPEYVGQHSGSDTPKTCLRCHAGPRWSDFDHVRLSGGFQLLGAHADLPCASCHAADGTPLYPGAGQDECIVCHQADYDGQHESQGYPTTCLLCHDRDAWQGASLDHDAQHFPIFSGTHRGKWQECATCHVDPADFGVFTCFNCHEHERTRMDDKHSDIPGYAYDPVLCLSCHPDGRG